jgi:hypothetical protein
MATMNALQSREPLDWSTYARFGAPLICFLLDGGVTHALPPVQLYQDYNHLA